MRLHQIPGYIQSIYLVEYDHGLLLLDGCCRADVDALGHFFSATLARPFSDLKVVVVTHMHPDHAGAANRLKALTGCQIASAKMGSPWHYGWKGSLMHLTEMMLTLWVATRLGKPLRNPWYSKYLKVDIGLSDGQPIPGFEDWLALVTPGHTDRDLSVYHKPSGKVYVADLLVKVKARFIPPFPVFLPNKYRASLQRIETLGPAAIWLAHGGEVRLTHQDYSHLMDSSPNTPQTYWRLLKSKIRQLVRRYPRLISRS